jgi:hypothetical protein
MRDVRTGLHRNLAEQPVRSLAGRQCEPRKEKGAPGVARL